MTVDPNFVAQPQQPWVADQLRRDHTEALYGYGEYAMFLLMWTPLDLEAGRVGPCPQCVIAYDRFAKAFRQPAKEKCPNCFGTGLDGGYRARIVRPSLWNDGAPDQSQSARGYVVTNTFTVETTDDFTLHHQDYVFRATGDRFQTETLTPTYIQTGFASPEMSGQRVAGSIPQVRLEDKASVAYMIPPDTDALVALLTQPVSLNVDFSAVEVVRGPLVLHASR